MEGRSGIQAPTQGLSAAVYWYVHRVTHLGGKGVGVCPRVGTDNESEQPCGTSVRGDDEDGQMGERRGPGNLVDSKSGELGCTNTECLYMQADLERRSDGIGVTGMTWEACVIGKEETENEMIHDNKM
jgi:hypothetical protein